MEKKRSVGVKVFGTVNIILGSIILIVGLPSLLMGFLWILPDSIFIDYPYTADMTNNLIVGISSIIFYLSAILLIWLGNAMRKRKPNSIKLAIILGVSIFLSSLLYIYHEFRYLLGAGYGIEATIKITFLPFQNGVMEGMLFIFYIAFLYWILLISYLTRPKVKEQFK